jgi:O-antigen/teichoic acid export membrane protein
METSRPTWIMIQNAYGLIVGYLIYYLIFRHAGVLAFGIFSFALSFGLLFSFISDLGINTAHTKMISSGSDRNEYNSAFILMKVFLTLIYVSVVLLSLFVWRVILHRGFETRYELLSILILIPYFISLPFIQGIRSFLTGTLEAAKMAIPSIVETTVRLISVVVFIEFNIFNIKNIDEMAVMIALSYSLSYVAYFILNIYVGRPWKFKWPKFSIIKEYLKYSYPLMGASIIMAVSSNIAQILIQTFFHSYELGGYAGDLRIITIITSFTGSLTILILPLLASHKGTEEEYKIRLIYLLKFIALFVSPLVAFVTAFSAPILNLWSDQLIPFSFPLQILLISSWFTILLNPYQTHFNATGQTKISAVLSIISALLIIIFDVILIPGTFLGIKLLDMGVVGAAYSSLISSIITFVVAVILVHRGLKVFITFDTIKAALISVILILPFYIYFDDNAKIPFFILAGVFLVYGLLYVLVTRAIKLITKEEMRDILNIFNIKKLLRYAIDELKKPSQ